jgi:uncharacterized protein (TIGR02246 family)
VRGTRSSTNSSRADPSPAEDHREAGWPDMAVLAPGDLRRGVFLAAIMNRRPDASVTPMTDLANVETLYRSLLARWNERDAAGYGALFATDGSLVGYDGSSVASADSITEHLAAIFSDHVPATYVAKVREVRPLGEGVALLRGVVGMVPPGETELNPERNAVQALVAVETDNGWRVAHFHNTPAAFDGRPEEAEALTAELRQVLASHG